MSDQPKIQVILDLRRKRFVKTLPLNQKYEFKVDEIAVIVDYDLSDEQIKILVEEYLEKFGIEC